MIDFVLGLFFRVLFWFPLCYAREHAPRLTGRKPAGPTRHGQDRLARIRGGYARKATDRSGVLRGTPLYLHALPSTLNQRLQFAGSA